MKESPQKNTAQEMATLLGGDEIEVSLFDGSTRRLRVALLPVRRYPEYFKLLMDDNEPGLVELLTDEPREAVDRLTPDAVAAVVELGDELNFQAAVGWATRKKDRLTRMVPILEQVTASVKDYVQETVLPDILSVVKASQKSSPTTARSSAPPVKQL